MPHYFFSSGQLTPFEGKAPSLIWLVTIESARKPPRTTQFNCELQEFSFIRCISSCLPPHSFFKIATLLATLPGWHRKKAAQLPIIFLSSLLFYGSIPPFLHFLWDKIQVCFHLFGLWKIKGNSFLSYANFGCLNLFNMQSGGVR